jgi:cyanophycin synthetase
VFEIIEKRFLAGPNTFQSHSLVVLRTQFEQSAYNLLQRPVGMNLGGLSGLSSVPGGGALLGLVERARVSLKEGDNGFALAQSLALEIQRPTTVRPALGRVIDTIGTEVINLVPADVDRMGLAAWEFACKVAIAIQSGRALDTPALFELVEQGQEAGRMLRAFGLDILSVAVARRALELDLPFCRPDPQQRTLQFGQGPNIRYSFETMVSPAEEFAFFRARDKWATVQRLRQLGLPVFPSAVAVSEDQALRLGREMGGPLVVKPVDGGKGHGITLDINGDNALRQAYRLARKYDRKVLIERMGGGDDVRLLVIDGKLVAAAKRLPAMAIGDGKSTIGELIEVINADPRRGEPYEGLMDRIVIDQRLDDLIAKQGFNRESIPPAGKEVRLSLAANISQGGTAVDVTDLVHPDVREAAERAAIGMDLGVVGIDFVSSDISVSWRKNDAAIIEVNMPPGLRPHWIADPERDVVTPLVRRMFPEGAPSRIPTAAITGSLGKTTTCQILASIAEAAGKTAGRTTTQGVWSGTFQLAKGDWAGGRQAFALLTDPTIDIGIFEFARGGLHKLGMSIDNVEVAAVLNVLDNHLGLDGIQTREEMVHVKGVPVRAARKAVWLNAEDEHVLSMRKWTKGKALGLVSLDPENPGFSDHLAAGGKGVTVKGDGEKARLYLLEGEQSLFEMDISEIPAASDGHNRSVVANAAFAIGIAYDLDLEFDHIRRGLAEFTSDSSQNPGRHNWIEGLPFQLVLNWCDGPVPFRQFVAQMDQTPCENGTILYISSPGNRTDEWLGELGMIASGHFDQIVVSDMSNLRGRPAGEAAGLIAEAAIAAGMSDAKVTRIDDPAEAMHHALDLTKLGQRLAMVTYDTELALQIIDHAKSGENATKSS